MIRRDPRTIGANKVSRQDLLGQLSVEELTGEMGGDYHHGVSPSPIDLIGRLVPEPASAWNEDVGRRHRGEAVTGAADRRQRRPQASLAAGAFLVSLGLGWVGGWNSSSLIDFYYSWKQPPRDDMACLADERSSTELAQARAYLVQTASPSYTMAQQGPELAIARLHPEFAIRLAKALREARDSGLSSAGIYSAYRPPAFGVGGFSDKFNSLHAYGLAVDLYGIGRLSSGEAQRWHEIAASHGVICPYGPQHKSEWNHCQPTGLKIVLAENLLRDTITADGPVSLEAMFEAGNSVVESLANEANSRQIQAAALAQESRACPKSRAIPNYAELRGSSTASWATP